MSKIVAAVLHDMAVIVLIVVGAMLLLGLVFGLHVIAALAG